MSTGRLLQLSDVHFGGEDVAASQAAVDWAHGFGPELTVVTGDLTLNGLPHEFVAAAEWVARLPLPRVLTPGNHDTPYWNLPLRALTPFGRYRRWIGDPFADRFDSDDLGVRMINTARGAQPRLDWSKGAINLDVARGAARELSSGANRRLRVVGCHHPLVEAANAPVSGGVYRGALAAEILAGGGVDLILTGHVHVPFAVPLVAGERRSYAVGASTLSIRLRGTPAGFNAIVWDDTTIEVTAQGWTGTKFAPVQSWSLPRR